MTASVAHMQQLRTSGNQANIMQSRCLTFDIALLMWVSGLYGGCCVEPLYSSK